MNRSELRKNIGKKFKFFPIPTRNSASGPYESDKNLWLLRREATDQKGFEFFNLFGNYNPLILDPLKINNFDEPDTLILRGQVIFDGSTVRYEPFTPKPASLLTPITNLSMSLEGAYADGLLAIADPPIERLRFVVTNTGEQTVRDYRNTVLIPQAFSRTTSDSYVGNLSPTSTVTRGEQVYCVYGNFIDKPIYKDERILIGQLPLRANPGEYTLLWNIRCDDGVFPSDKTYGEIIVRVAPLGDLADRADKDLFKS